jgi:hypothetical protein
MQLLLDLRECDVNDAPADHERELRHEYDDKADTSETALTNQANRGISMTAPPAIADSWAQSPAAVQSAATTASMLGRRDSTRLRTNS